MGLVHFSNRESSRIGLLIEEGTDAPWPNLDWPVVQLADGDQRALNPGLNRIRPATRWEEIVWEWRRR